MKKFFSWLIKPAVLSLLGVLLLSLVIWFEAPLLSFDGSAPFESSSVRWTLIILAFIIWAGWFAWRMLAVKLANIRLMKSVAGEDAPAQPAGAGESAAELEVLGKRMQEAMAILKKSTSAKKGGLYQLPWYMFIGAPGTGKTTALTQSGLKFPLAESMGKGAIGGVGGTRNCDWWFTDEAVLLDTAGRYTTQDSHSDADKAAWNGFLQLLRKHRKRRPINGVILALSVSDLLQESDAWRKTQAQAIRERIKELHEQLGVRFPVYVLVTKCDLLAGFMEYFDSLGREERAQVWGVTFPLGEASQLDTALEAFADEFRLLEQQLQARVLARVQQERDPHKRALVYSFPQQFAGVGEVLGGFLKDVFESNRYEQQALLRGVYFSSGTQEGSPLDRVMSAMAASFGLDRQVLPPNGSTGRSYFITNLLQQVIFPEAELAGVNHKLEARRRYLAWGASVGVALLFLLLGAGMITSYVRNQNYVAEMDAKSAEIAKRAAGLPAQGSTVQLLPLLDAMRALQADYSDDASSPWLMRFGLYQGDKLGQASQIAYHRMLRETLLPRIAQRMEDQLRRNSANNNEYLYEVLRVYLMLGDAAHFDAESVAAWVAYDDERNLQDASDEQKEALAAHQLALLSNYRDEQAMPQLDAQLISDTRLTLARMPLEQRVYNRLKRQLVLAKLPEFSAATAGGRDASAVFVRRSGEPITRGVNGMFSVAGYAKFLEQSEEAVADVEKERWVLAQQEASTLAGDGDQVKAAVLQLYYNDYIAQWDALLADVAVTSFSNLEQGARITNLLSGADSPLKKFMVAAARETKLGATKAQPLSSVSNKVKGKLDSYKKKLESAIGSTIDDGTPAAPAKAMNPVDAHFEDLHKMTAGTPAPIDATLAMLKDVAIFMDASAAAKRTGAPPPPGDALAKVKLEADGKPAPLGAMLKTIDSSGAGLASGSERERLNALWTAGPAQFCRQALAGRYPIVRSAAQDVTADDFGRLFAPGGLIDDFFQKNLVQYVDMSGARWSWRATANNASLGIAQSTLDGFQAAAKVRDAFFGNGGRQASMRFDLKPLAIDAAMAKFTLDIDGQVFTAAPGAATSAQFQLPSGKGNGQVRLEALPASARSSLRTEGPWAWFHMLDKATVEPTAQGERYKVTFDVDGRKATLELTASSVVNPFRRSVLEQFRCMDRL